MMQKVYGDECLSRSIIYEWFVQSKGQGGLNDEERFGRSTSAANDENGQFVREFIKKRARTFVALHKNKIEYIQRLNSSNFYECYRSIYIFWAMRDNAPADRSMLITDFFTKSSILNINHSPYSPDLAPCNFYLFRKLHLAMKEKGYANIKDIRRSTTAILNTISTDKIKMSFNLLLDRAKRCIYPKWDYFEWNK